MTREPDGELSFRTPHGRLLPAVARPSSPPTAPVVNLREENAYRGIHIDAHTSMPSWLGERLDLDHAISVLHPLACRPSRMA